MWMRGMLLGTLTLLATACGGGSSSGPSTPSAAGTWIVDFNTGQATCSLSQLAVTLDQGETGAWGATAVSCIGKNAIPEGPGQLVKWSQSGSSVGIIVSQTPSKLLYQGVMATRDSMTGNFNWDSGSTAYPPLSGTFVAHRQ